MRIEIEYKFKIIYLLIVPNWDSAERHVFRLFYSLKILLAASCTYSIKDSGSMIETMSP